MQENGDKRVIIMKCFVQLYQSLETPVVGRPGRERSLVPVILFPYSLPIVSWGQVLKCWVGSCEGALVADIGL